MCHLGARPFVFANSGKFFDSGNPKNVFEFWTFTIKNGQAILLCDLYSIENFYSNLNFSCFSVFLQKLTKTASNH